LILLLIRSGRIKWTKKLSILFAYPLCHLTKIGNHRFSALLCVYQCIAKQLYLQWRVFWVHCYAVLGGSLGGCSLVQI